MIGPSVLKNAWRQFWKAKQIRLFDEAKRVERQEQLNGPSMDVASIHVSPINADTIMATGYNFDPWTTTGSTSFEPRFPSSASCSSDLPNWVGNRGPEIVQPYRTPRPRQRWCYYCHSALPADKLTGCMHCGAEWRQAGDKA